LKTKKQSRPPAPIKAAFTANFAFDAAAGDLRPAEAVLAWLNGRAVRRVSPEDIQRHLAGLRDRVGGETGPKRAAANSVDWRLFTAPPIWVREFGFATFDLDGIQVSVDVFNAADEHQLGEEARNVVELFRVDGREVTPLVNAAVEVMDATDTHLVFGGISFFADMFLGFRQEGPDTRRGALGIADLLWPLMGLRKDYADDVLAALPVHKVVKARRGVVIQAFADLWTGGKQEYDDAAHRLGLTSFYEAQAYRKK
jgi:hypothetical protein